MTWRTFQMFFEACEIFNPVFWSNLKIFKMEIRNASATPSKSNKLRKSKHHKVGV